MEHNYGSSSSSSSSSSSAFQSPCQGCCYGEVMVQGIPTRSHVVQVIVTCRPKPEALKYGVPQCSVHGPVLFTMHMQTLRSVISHCGVLYHSFADDTHLQQSSHPEHFFYQPVTTTETRIKSVKVWMTTKKLKLNTDKTEVMPVGTEPKLSWMSGTSTLINSARVCTPLLPLSQTSSTVECVIKK